MMSPGAGRPEELIREYPASQWIIWAGAGVSFDRPASLPLGYPLTDFAVEEMCGPTVRRQLLDVWDRANRLCSTPGGAAPFGWRPRLESVLGGFAELELGAEPGLAFLPGFTSFADAPPNPQHLAIAALVLRGAAVLTSNFDLCIQAAFRELPSRDEAVEVAASGAIRRFRLRDRPGTGEIVHFHGAADDPGSLGATLSKVKEGFPRPFPELEDRLRAGSLVVMVGYSAGDSFDVNPYFASQSPGTWPASTLLFVQHKGYDPPAHVPELAAGFGRYGILVEDTGEFLARLDGVARGARGREVDWRERFRTRISARTGQAPLRTCSLANAVGISVDVLDPGAYAAAEAANPGFDPQRYHHLLAIAGRERGVPGKELEHHRLGGGTEGDTLGYEYARGNLRKARAQALPMDEILRLAQADRELSWAPYTSMSAHGRVLLAPYLQMPSKRPHGRRELHAIQRFSEVVDALALRPLRGVQYIRQIATARRFRLLLDSLIAPGAAPWREREILDLYGNLADLAGYVSSYRDFALARLLGVRYADRARRAEMLDDANVLIRRSEDLAALIGNPAGVRRARRLGVYLRLARAFWSLPLPPATPPPSTAA